MTGNPLAVVAVTVALIVLSAFFVVIEFALLGARSHRLEADAATSRSARAALRGINELTIMLAGAQLGGGQWQRLPRQHHQRRHCPASLRQVVW
jgi:CBS domain containing-hemolysin-like protein